MSAGRSDGQQPVAAQPVAAVHRCLCCSVLFSGQFGIIDCCAPLVTRVSGCSAAACSITSTDETIAARRRLVPSARDPYS